MKFIDTIIKYFIRNIPGGLGRKIRYFYYKDKFGRCGKNIYIDVGVIIDNPEHIFLENNIWIDNYVILLTGKPSDKGVKLFRKTNSSFIYNEGELHISKNVHIAPFCVLQAHGGISIGANCGIASGSKIYSLSNHYKNVADPEDKQEYFFTPLAEPERQSYISSAVVIQENCAIGLNSVILPGTTIPKGTWIGVNTTIAGQELKTDSIYSSDFGKFVKNK